MYMCVCIHMFFFRFCNFSGALFFFLSLASRCRSNDRCEYTALKPHYPTNAIVSVSIAPTVRKKRKRRKKEK